MAFKRLLIDEEQEEVSCKRQRCTEDAYCGQISANKMNSLTSEAPRELCFRRCSDVSADIQKITDSLSRHNIEMLKPQIHDRLTEDCTKRIAPLDLSLSRQRIIGDIKKIAENENTKVMDSLKQDGFKKDAPLDLSVRRPGHLHQRVPSLTENKRDWYDSLVSVAGLCYLGK